jgi:hypothetical protein
MIINNALQGLQFARVLKSELEDAKIISDECSFPELDQNAPLKRAILKYLGACLPNDINPNDYGSGIVSMFDLYHNCITDDTLDSTLSNLPNERFITLGITKVIARSLLQKKRINLRAFVARQRNLTIYNFELPDTPPRKKTPAEAKSNAVSAITSAKSTQSTNSSITLDLDETEMDSLAENGEKVAIIHAIDAIVPEDTQVSKKRRTNDKWIDIMTELVEAHPDIATVGIYIKVDIKNDTYYWQNADSYKHDNDTNSISTVKM